MSGSKNIPETKAQVMPISTSMLPDTRLGADWIASAPAAIQGEFLDTLSAAELRALPYMFEFWAHPHQMPPEGPWRTWVIMGGRGAGKTRAGAEWVRSMVEGNKALDPGKAKRVALVGETLDEVREVMVFGESGILACSPPDRRPAWIAGRKMLVWPNGAIAQLFSAHDPDSMRGPQFDAVWADELAKWKKGGHAWSNVQLCLRLGQDPRACVTTTPQNVKVLKDLLGQESTVITQAPTASNRAYLASGFLEEVQRLYAGTRLGRQELDGELLAEIDGALWTSRLIERAGIDLIPEMDRVVVAVDPPATSGDSADECGIVVVGAVMSGEPHEWQAYVLEDASVSTASPTEWAQAAAEAFRHHGADRMVAEVNQGGEMVESVIRQVAPNISFKPLRATRGKALRAEPVAALYERGQVRHVRGLTTLEQQMEQMTITGFRGAGSPDRVDALVWGLHELMLGKLMHAPKPRLRAL